MLQNELVIVMNVSFMGAYIGNVFDRLYLT
jgi:hypothetical protein